MFVMNDKVIVIECVEDDFVWGFYGVYDCLVVIIFVWYVWVLMSRCVLVIWCGVFWWDNYCCGYCGKVVFMIDYILLCLCGGVDFWENFVVCCLCCNNVKSDCIL